MSKSVGHVLDVIDIFLPTGGQEDDALKHLTSLRWHYPDQVIRVFLSLHKEGHPESFKTHYYDDVPFKLERTRLITIR